MGRFKNLFGSTAGNVLKKEQRETPTAGPHRFLAGVPLSSSSARQYDTTTFTMPSFDSDVKLDLSATYTPGSSNAGIDLPGAPPGYVSREPSVSTPAMPMADGRRVASAPTPTLRATTTELGSFDSSRRSIAFPPMPSVPPPAIPSVHLQRSPQNAAPGDLPMQREPGQKITAEELNDLADMVRQRYQLDIQIHSERFLRPRDRDITQAKIRKADALLCKIQRTVISWDKPEYFEHGTGDYEAFQEVAERVLKPGKRDWLNEPPWSNAAMARPSRQYL